jgi:hypothetical protein
MSGSLALATDEQELVPTGIDSTDEQELIPTELSRKEGAAIHCESLAGDEVVLDQEQDGLRDVVTASDATDGDVGGNARVDQRFAHLCVDQAWCDGVYCNALGCESQSIGAGQTFYPSLSRAVGDAARACANPGSDRRDIDDPAPAPCAHVRQDSLGAEKGGL